MYVILLQVMIKSVCSQRLHDFKKLIIIVGSPEEVFALEQHGCEHTAETP